MTLSGFIAGLVITFVIGIRNIEVRDDCRAPFNYYELHIDGSKMVINGVYYHIPSGSLEGKISFTGTVRYMGAKGEMLKDMQVNREVDYQIHYRSGHVIIETLLAGSRQGDSISDEDVKKYIFPSGGVGEKASANLFLLNGAELAIGPARTPRLICY